MNFVHEFPRAEHGQSLVVYVCHPYSDNVPLNVARVTGICRAITEAGHVPLAPHLFLGDYVAEATHRDLAMAHCNRLVEVCDQLWIFYPGKDLYDFGVSPGMQVEIAHARQAWGATAAQRIKHIFFGKDQVYRRMVPAQQTP
jgi:hypothetical protein